MKSNTQQAVDWLLEPTSDRRTIAEAAKKFGLNSAEGVGLALKKARIKKLSDELNAEINHQADRIRIVEKWNELYKLLK